MRVKKRSEVRYPLWWYNNCICLHLLYLQKIHKIGTLWDKIYAIIITWRFGTRQDGEDGYHAWLIPKRTAVRVRLLHPECVAMLLLFRIHCVTPPFSKLSRKATRGNGGQLAIGSSGKAPKKQILRHFASARCFFY